MHLKIKSTSGYKTPDIQIDELEVLCITTIEEDCSAFGTVTNTYANTGSSLWTDPSNWSVNLVLSKCHDVIISEGETVMILSTESAQCSTLQVGQTAEMIVGIVAVLDVITGSN